MRQPEKSKTVALYAVTRQAAACALKVAQGLEPLWSAQLFLPRRLEPDFGGQALYFDSSAAAIGENFKKFSAHIMVGAIGMTVRHIAPHLETKTSDPAVVALTQDGRFAVSLLSGHLGGANELAQQTAAVCGGQAVIGTATDVEGVPALEVLARDHGLVLEDFKRLPLISRLLVEGAQVPVYDPDGYLWPQLAQWPNSFSLAAEAPVQGPQLRVSFRLQDNLPAEALALRPRCLALAMGCHRGIDTEEVENFIDEVLARERLSPKAVALLATVESRAQEPAFLSVSQKRGWPLVIFTKDELSQMEVPNPSGKVMERIGVASVCEAAAMLAAQSGSLLISKQKSPRATLAAALIKARS